jgi:O-antigen biosynthesis protein
MWRVEINDAVTEVNTRGGNMAHLQQKEFYQAVKRRVPKLFSERLVVDLGEPDPDGNHQALFDDCLYLGIDLLPGQKVDFAANGHEPTLPDESVDVVVSTECPEDDQFCPRTLDDAVRMLKPGGLLLFTWAASGGLNRDARRTTPDQVPFNRELGERAKGCKHLEESHVRAALDLDAIFVDYAFATNSETHDLYLWGIKKGVMHDHSDRSLQTHRCALRLAMKSMEGRFAQLQQAVDERSRQVEDLNQIVLERDDMIRTIMADVAGMTGSKAWKFAMLVRKCRAAIVPPHSRPIRVIRRFKNTLFAPHTRQRFIAWCARQARRNSLVSVVIPIYDRTTLLKESIESILRQSYRDFEIILVCDGSPPETLAIVRDYERNNPKVRAFYFKNNSGNAVRGRNKGIKEARGKYLAFHDSDDVADRHRLKWSVAAIEQSNADVVYGGWRAIVDGSRNIDLKNGQEIFSDDCDLDSLRKACVPCQSTVMAKVDCLRAVGGLNEKMRYREDHELWLRLAHRGYRFKAIHEILTNLRLHGGNLEVKFKSDDAHWARLMMDEYQKDRRLKPKIGYVIPSTGNSGGIAVVCQHVSRLLRRGHDVTIVAQDNHDSLPWFPEQSFEVVPLDKAGDNYDILVATGWQTAPLVARLPAKRRLYFVQSDERRFYPSGDPLVREAAKTYKLDFEFMTIGRWMQKWLKDEFGKDSIYVPNGLDETVTHPTPPMLPKTDRLRVLLEGPIDVWFKGMSDAFQAVAGLDCEVWCVSSSGKPKPGWKCDRFFERVPLASMKRVYSSCDVLLKMSRVEGVCLPPLEMMACGGTVVIGQVTGIDEYIVDQVNALVVPQGDVRAAHNALQRLIDDRRLRNSLIENGRNTAKQWRWDKTIDTLEDFLYGETEQADRFDRGDADLDVPMRRPDQPDGQERRHAA